VRRGQQENLRTDCGSRSTGTAQYISVAPMSIPAALGSMVRAGNNAPDRGFFRLAGIESSPAPCQAARTVQKGNLLNGIG
jgi:hypothetical protein